MTENTVTTWRNVPGLTAQHVDELEGIEAYVRNAPQAQQKLVGHAQMLVERASIDTTYADVPLPAGAVTDTESWSPNETTGQWSRSVEWAHIDTGVPAVDVYIDGRQATDGTYTCGVALYAEDCKLTAEQAIAVARALLAAAGTLDKLTGDAPPFT